MRFGTGNPQASIMVVGECFTEKEERAGEAFLGPAGEAFNQMLSEAGISRSEVYMTNLCNSRPPYDDIGNWIAFKRKDITVNHTTLRELHVKAPVITGYFRLIKEIKLVNPTVIIAVGNMAMWAITGASGILKWRGSALAPMPQILESRGVHDAQNLGMGDIPSECKNVTTGLKSIVVIPTLPPMSVLYAQENRVLVVADLRRAKRHSLGKIPPLRWNFTIRPSFNTVAEKLHFLLSILECSPLWIDFDLETRAGHIACAGLSWTLNDAICIPFMCVENHNGYWTIEEETAIVGLLRKVLTHKHAKIRGQNLLYDCQYTYRHWYFVPNVAQDTMISHHTCFAGLPKSLAFQASLYCDNYIYWKDDGKTWTKNVGEDQLWSYNAVDCVRTRECGEVELKNIQTMGLESVEDFQQKLFWPVLQAMQRGVRIDTSARAGLSRELSQELQKRETYFRSVLGHPFNPRSPLQMCKLFYEDFGLQKIMSKAKKGYPAHLTCDDEALKLIAKREPLVSPLIRNIHEYRSLGVFRSTFVDAELDIDGRMRCSYNICGTETYRFNSSKNAFNSGTNLQNIPKGTDDGDIAKLRLPNVRKLFIPDSGFTFFDMDLDRADLQVVVWESNEPELKAALRKGVDMHLLNACALMGKDIDLNLIIDGTETHAKYKSDLKKERQLAKSFIHGTNYGGGARTMAIAASVTVHQAEKFQALYFGKYPGIKSWHHRTEKLLKAKKYVTNILGYRRFYFESVDKLLPEALAWIPQSTVACVINRAWVKIYENLPQVQVLLQVHDSLAGQFPTHLKERLLPEMKKQSQITLPYPDHLIIPTGIKVSEKSWGDCE